MIHKEPRIDLVVFPESVEIRALLSKFPEVQHILFSKGIEGRFINALYKADRDLTMVNVPPCGRLVRFGTSSHFSDGLYINPDTGGIVEVGQGRVRLFVNSSLKQFGQTVAAIVERFPFYSRTSDYDVNDEEVAVAVRDLSAIIGRIDPPAIIEDRFWSTFVDDVAIGDFATEDVVSLREQ